MNPADAQKALSGLLSRYDQKVFAFALYLMQGDRDKAYDVAASAFAETALVLPADHDAFLFLIKSVIRHSQGADPTPSSQEHELDLDKAALKDKKMLGFVRRMLYALPFKARAAVLLRDQWNLGYKDMAEIFAVTPNEMRHQTLQARKEIRTHLEDLLRDAR